MPDRSTPQAYVFQLKIGGVAASDALLKDVRSITVESSLHQPDVATLVLSDSSLEWIDADALSPGKSLEVAVKGPDGSTRIFDGEIVELEPDFGLATQALTVRAFDRMHRLARGRYARSFVNMSIGDVAKKIAGEAGLTLSGSPPAQVYEHILQTGETNLAFLQQWASRLGCALYVKEKTLYFKPLEVGSAVATLTWGGTLGELRPRLSTLGQASRAMVRGWDPETGKELESTAPKPFGAKPGVGVSSSGGALSKSAFSIDAELLVSHRPVHTAAEADALAQGALDRLESRFLEADGVCAGSPRVIAGATVKLDNVGRRFGGTWLVTAATHCFGPDGYSTAFSVSGLHPSHLLALLAPPPEAPSSPGLAIGIVTDIQDPKGQGRVKVKYPWLAKDHTSHWARVLAPGGGPMRGIEFLPEVNDEVLVGFELGDMQHPFVIGGLWSGKHAPPVKSNTIASNGKVLQRIIRSRLGHMIILDDAENGGGITLVDKGGSSVFIDSSKNAMTIDIKGDTTIRTKGNLAFEAGGGVRIDATSKIEIASKAGVSIDAGTGNADIKGMVVNLN